uniref:Uncharacterized protein n=1 Tax=Candidatus Kentrum sp. LFY TaxID=2126342 RepID=A0A450V9K2_9GAMM|nr:MAG: hypothetical protein BECKLFY1418A_GA0070994_11449 [Candidatus Kentron sp. LFY]
MGTALRAFAHLRKLDQTPRDNGVCLYVGDPPCIRFLASLEMTPSLIDGKPCPNIRAVVSIVAGELHIWERDIIFPIR